VPCKDKRWRGRSRICHCEGGMGFSGPISLSREIKYMQERLEPSPKNFTTA